MTIITNLECVDAIIQASLNTIEKQKIFIDSFESGDESLAYATGIIHSIDMLNQELLERDTYTKINESLLYPEYDNLDERARRIPLFSRQMATTIIDIIDNLKSDIIEASTIEQANTIISTTFKNFKPFSKFMGGIKEEQFLDFLDKKESEYTGLANALFYMKK